MYSTHKTFVLCLLILLDSGESFKLLQNGSRLNGRKLLSHIKKQPSKSAVSSSITRQLHTCTVECNFQLAFTDPLVLPEECVRIETNDACGVLSSLDYTSNTTTFYTYADSELLIFGNTIYDTSTIHLASIYFANNLIDHAFEHVCANGDDCEWKYVQEIVPKLIVLDYQPLKNSLSPLIYNSNQQPSITQCYNYTQLINCTSGSCWFFQSVDSNNNAEIYRECSNFEESFAEVAKIRYTPGPTTYDEDIIDIECNKDNCNGQSNELSMKNIISSQGNEYIISINSTNSSGTTVQTTVFTSTSSSGTTVQTTVFDSFFLALALINILFC